MTELEKAPGADRGPCEGAPWTVPSARRSQEELIARLRQLGLRFRTVTVSTEGDYAVADADWNVKDVPHLNHVHGWADNVNGLTDPHAEASINLQRVLGLRLPLVLSHYDSAPDRQTYFFTLLTYTMVCEIAFEEVGPNRTRVVTTYGVGATRFWMLFFPIIAWLLKRNFRVLMSEDLPMRERRGQLRSWGYSFRSDSRPRSFRASLDTGRDNVLPPALPAAGGHRADEPVTRIPLSRLREGGLVLTGRSDHLGLRLTVAGATVAVHPRLCRHEGACLDDAPVRGDGGIRCPWHGRRLGPLGRLDLEDEDAVLTLPGLRLERDGEAVVVRSTEALRAPAGA